MSTISIVRYVGFFYDCDYAPFGDVAADGEAFFTLRDARNALRIRGMSNGERSLVYFPVPWDGMVATHACKPETEVFFGATQEAYIDLYPVVPAVERKGWGHVGEPSYRVSFGPRFGTHTETF